MSDDDLVLAFLGGDRPAFDALFERYRGPIWAFFRRRTSTSADAEELAQETFLAVLQGARRYEPRASFRSYLFGIAFNVLLAWRRKTGRRGDESIQADTLAAPAHDPSSAIWVREALAALDPEDREILMLREYDALEYAEIARVTGVPINTVRSRLFRARMALREQLAPDTAPAAPREDSESASAGARASGGGAVRAVGSACGPREDSESASAGARASGGGAVRAVKSACGPREDSESASAGARASGGWGPASSEK